MEMTVSEIAALLNVAVRPGTRGVGGAAAALTIRGVASLDEASPSDVSVLTSGSYLKQFKSTRAGAVIVDRSVRLPPTSEPALLIVDHAGVALTKILARFAPPIPRPPRGVDPSARLAPSSIIDPAASIGPNVVVGEGSAIGPRSVIHAGVVIGASVLIGADCELFPNVVLRERITIGDRVIINAGSVLGTDGFGYRWNGKQHEKIPQIGTILVEDDVEIGSCVCIDRAKMGITRVGRGTKVDNLVQIAHNCRIGPNCIIVGQVGLAGSVTLGEGVVLGGQTAVRDHIALGDGAVAAARSAIAEDVDPGTTVSGMPALPHRQSLREQAALRRLPDLVAQVRRLQDEVEKLKAAAAK